VDVQVTGPAATQSPEQVEQMRAKWGLPVGEPFRQSTWDKAKEDALVTLQSRSYYGAKLAASRARVEPDEQAADLSARYESGPAYMLGPLVVEGTRRYPEQIVRNVNPLNVGEPYRVERLLELQRAVQNQPYSNVQVDLVEPADAVAEAKGEAGTASDAATEADGATTTTKTTKATQPGYHHDPGARAVPSNRCIASIPASVTRPTLARR
jgi:translocation and assembly module TamA